MGMETRGLWNLPKVENLTRCPEGILMRVAIICRVYIQWGFMYPLHVLRGDNIIMEC